MDEEGLFHFHEKPNTRCPVGRNIHAALDDRLSRIQTSMEEQMKAITVAEVVKDIRKKIKAKK